MLELLKKFQLKAEVSQDVSKQKPFAFEVAAFDSLGKMNSFGQKYPLLDMDFLKLRNKDGLPKFAIFTLDHATSFFRVTLNFYRESSSPHNVSLEANCTKSVIVSRYHDVFHLLKRYAWFEIFKSWGTPEKVWITLETTFPGIIPANIRKEINEVKNDFDEVILVAEAPKWMLDSKVINYPPNPDPLVVGIKGDFCYLINSFDVTLLENYVTKEFTE